MPLHRSWRQRPRSETFSAHTPPKSAAAATVPPAAAAVPPAAAPPAAARASAAAGTIGVGSSSTPLAPWSQRAASTGGRGRHWWMRR